MIESRAPRRMRHSWEARCRLVRLMLDGVAPSQAAVVCGASRATAYRALARYRVGGWEALRDRPPIARSHPARLSSEAERQIVALRRATGWGPKRLAGVLAGRPRRSGGCCAGTASHVVRRLRARRPIATSTRLLVSSYISISSSSGVSGRSASGLSARALGIAVHERAGAICTWLSTITRGMRSRNCARRRPALMPWPFSSTRSSASLIAASGCSGS